MVRTQSGVGSRGNGVAISFNSIDFDELSSVKMVLNIF